MEQIRIDILSFALSKVPKQEWVQLLAKMDGWLSPMFNENVTIEQDKHIGII